MGIFDKLNLYKAAVSAPMKADIDSLIGQIDQVQQGILTAQTEDQLKDAISNTKYYTDRADRYMLRKRAEAVGLPSMGRGNPSEKKREKWLDELLRLEEEKRSKTFSAE